MDEPAPPPVLTSAEPVAPAAPIRPRARPSAWPFLLAPFAAFVASLFTMGMAAFAVAGFSDPAVLTDAEDLKRWVEANQFAFPVIAVPLLVGQITFLATAALFGMLVRDPSTRRLGFVRSRASITTVALAVLGTLGVQFLLDLAANWLIEEPSEALKAITRMMVEPQGLAAVGIGFLISVVPGVCEETLYRGFMQPGLLRRWSPFAAIGLTSVLFAAMHGDVQHALLVLPLGIWFGFVAWRTASVWPSVLCHFVNNLTAFVFVRLFADTETLETPDEWPFLVAGAVLVACGVLAAFKLMRTKAEER